MRDNASDRQLVEWVREGAARVYPSCRPPMGPGSTIWRFGTWETARMLRRPAPCSGSSDRLCSHAYAGAG